MSPLCIRFWDQKIKAKRKYSSFEYKRTQAKLCSSRNKLNLHFIYTHHRHPSKSFSQKSPSRRPLTSCSRHYNMKSTFVAVLTVALAAAAAAAPDPQIPGPCDICNKEKPTCPVGQIASGQPGCWGCCEFILPRAVERDNKGCDSCLPKEPTCPPGEIPSGHEGCWGCCVRPPASPCDICLSERPGCPIGQAPGGRPGCWACCEPID
jgi:hypothetical protein